MELSPRSSGDRAPPSGGGCAGSNPAGGTYDSLAREGFHSSEYLDVIVRYHL